MGWVTPPWAIVSCLVADAVPNTVTSDTVRHSWVTATPTPPTHVQNQTEVRKVTAGVSISKVKLLNFCAIALWNAQWLNNQTIKPHWLFHGCSRVVSQPVRYSEDIETRERASGCWLCTLGSNPCRPLLPRGLQSADGHPHTRHWNVAFERGGRRRAPDRDGGCWY